MKNILHSLLFATAIIIWFAITSTAQNTFPSTGAAGIGTTSPNASSLLEVKSTSKGVLFPRMTQSQRNAIASPVEGLLIYQTDHTAGFYYYNGSTWAVVTPKKGWSLTGNSGTTPSTNFIGTTDAQPLAFKVNNTLAGYLDYNAALANTGFGYQCLGSNTGGGNTAVGYQANYSNTSGYQNTAIGADALYTNTTGGYNVAVGLSALQSNTEGFSNTAVGQRCMYLNSTGGSNSACGQNALYNNTTGSYNTAIGFQSLFSNIDEGGNTATGYQSLYSNNAGLNTANGYQSLYSNTSGSNNTAAGYLSLYANTTGFNNTAYGNQALSSNSSGNYNTAVGNLALDINTGSNNTAVGETALWENTTGGGNVGIGSSALNSNSSGSYNTALGTSALYNNTTGSENTGLGDLAEPNSGGYTNSTALGYFSLITASDQVRIGNNSIVSIGGYTNWTNVSDGRVKKNIKQNVPGLSFINKLQPVTYNLDLDAADKIVQRPDLKDQDGKLIQPSRQESDARQQKEQIVYSGFVAQDVEKAAKEIGYDFSGVDPAKNDKDLYGLRYAEFVVPLVKAVQELSARNDELENRISFLENQSPKSNSPSPDNGFAELKTLNSQPETILGQNIPNPFDNSTLIPFRIPKDCHDASIMIVNSSSSEVVSIIPIACNEDHVSIDAGTLASGSYSYSLYVNGKLIDTKSMVIAK